MVAVFSAPSLVTFRNASRNHYKLTDLILGVVSSTPFQNNTAAQPIAVAERK